MCVCFVCVVCVFFVCVYFSLLQLARRSLPVAGPSRLSLKDMVQITAHGCRLPTLAVPTPVFVHRIVAWALGKLMAEPPATPAQLEVRWKWEKNFDSSVFWFWFCLDASYIYIYISLYIAHLLNFARG